MLRQVQQELFSSNQSAFWQVISWTILLGSSCLCSIKFLTDDLVMDLFIVHLFYLNVILLSVLENNCTEKFKRLPKRFVMNCYFLSSRLKLCITLFYYLFWTYVTYILIITFVIWCCTRINTCCVVNML